MRGRHARLAGHTDARSPHDQLFGRNRLVDLISRHLAADVPTPERRQHAAPPTVLDGAAGDEHLDTLSARRPGWHFGAGLSDHS